MFTKTVQNRKSPVKVALVQNRTTKGKKKKKTVKKIQNNFIRKFFQFYPY